MGGTKDQGGAAGGTGKVLGGEMPTWTGWGGLSVVVQFSSAVGDEANKQEEVCAAPVTVRAAVLT